MKNNQDINENPDASIPLSAAICSGIASGSSLTATDWQEIDRLAIDGREDLAWKIRSGEISAEKTKVAWESEADQFNGWDSLGGDEKNNLLFPNVERSREG